MVQVFEGVRGLMTFWKVKKVTREGAQNSTWGKTKHQKEKKDQNSIWGKTGPLKLPLSICHTPLCNPPSPCKTRSRPTLAKATLANFSVSMFWPIFLTLKSPNPKTQKPTFKPQPQTPETPGEGAQQFWALPSEPLRGPLHHPQGL